MFYRLSSIGIVVLGVFQIAYAFFQHIHIDEEMINILARGMSTALIGLLNFVFLYETPRSNVPRIILLGANGAYIGYLILMITTHVALLTSWASLALLFITSILVLNRRV
jgi:hypothetical protein